MPRSASAPTSAPESSPATTTGEQEPHRHRRRRLHRSDSILVAPVSIGDGAYVAAASCITKDVPSDALGISRPELQIKEGWASRKRAKLAAAKQKP